MKVRFRRAFLLIDAEHGPKPLDFMLLDHMGASGIPYQIVMSKVDKLRPEALQEAFDNIRELLTDRKERRGTSALGEILGTAADPAKKKHDKVGISDLRWAVAVAAGLDAKIGKVHSKVKSRARVQEKVKLGEGVYNSI